MKGACVSALVSVVLVFASAHGLDLDRGVIAHLFEWRWPDIAKECEDVLAPGHFAGVQISPPNENLIISGRPWYERYQPVSYKLQTRSGTRRQLEDMVRRCNKVGVRVFADTVINHMTKAEDAGKSCRGTAGSACSDRARDYPSVPYTRADFNPECQIKDWNDPFQVRNCELVGLHDLNQTIPNVRTRIINFMNELIDLGMGGFRIDAAKHMWPSDLKVIYDSLKNLSTEHGFAPGTRPFIYQEVSAELWEKISYKEYTELGKVTDFRYGSFLGTAFQGKNLSNLENFGPYWNILPYTDSITFIDNHDTERSQTPWTLTKEKPQAYKMAIAFMLAHGQAVTQVLSSFKHRRFTDGPPTYSGLSSIKAAVVDGVCADGWACQHRWPQVYNMVYFRQFTKGLPINSWWDNGFNQIAFSVGNKGFMAFNAEPTPMKVMIKTNLPAGQYCDLASGDMIGSTCSGKWHTVNKDGTVIVEIGAFKQWNTDVNGFVAFLNTEKTMEAAASDEEEVKEENNNIAEESEEAPYFYNDDSIWGDE